MLRIPYVRLEPLDYDEGLAQELKEAFNDYEQNPEGFMKRRKLETETDSQVPQKRARETKSSSRSRPSIIDLESDDDTVTLASLDSDEVQLIDFTLSTPK